MFDFTDNWLQIEERHNERTYTIRQDKWAPLKISVALVSIELVFLALASIGGALNSLGILLVFGLFAFLLALPCVVVFVIGLAASLTWSPVSRFRISPTEIFIEPRNERARPLKLSLKEISHLYVGAGGRAKSSRGVSIVTSEPVTSRTYNIARAYDDLVMQYDFGLWVNYRGKDIYLAKHLDEPKADYLFDELKRTMKFGRVDYAS